VNSGTKGYKLNEPIVRYEIKALPISPFLQISEKKKKLIQARVD
jgi:hypothetical protein